MNNSDEKRNNLESLARRLQDVENTLRGIPSGSMLSSSDIRELAISRDVPRMKELFRMRKWDEIAKKTNKEGSFIIDPFDPVRLTPFSYDLSIGDEAFSCRLESRSSFRLSNTKNTDRWHWMKPGETVIVRTAEYIALPNIYSATVWPRFNLVREGIFQSMVKIDPTWYGQLAVALTNHSSAEYPIHEGLLFGTLILYRLSTISDIALMRKGETLDPEIKVSLKDVSKSARDEVKITKSKLNGKCRIANDSLFISVALDTEEFEQLRQLSDDESWQEAVNDAIKIKTNNAIGLPSLELLLTNQPRGRRLTRENIEQAGCTQSDLISTAVEQGKPFDLMARIPALFHERVNEQVSQELDKQVGKEIIPRLITLMFTVLGFLSIVVALLALVGGYLKLEFPLEFSLTGTLVAIMTLLMVCLLPAALWLFFLGLPRRVRTFKKELGKVDLTLRKEIENLWSEVSSLKKEKQ